jgi:hypothetical protein
LGKPGYSHGFGTKTGYADLESQERFPHPHSLDDGGEMQEAHYQIGVREVSRPLPNQK